MRPTVEERRKHKRYELDNSVSVSSSGIFQITNISLGGFCFRCPPFTSIPDVWKTDILSSVDKLERFPAKRAWVSMVANSGHQFLPMIVGIKFGKLTKKQKAQLSQVIKIVSHSEGIEQ